MRFTDMKEFDIIFYRGGDNGFDHQGLRFDNVIQSSVQAVSTYRKLC